MKTIRDKKQFFILALASILLILLAGQTLAGDMFSPTGNMTDIRYDHSATLLSDGKVLLVGGQNTYHCCSLIADAELYDPITGTFTATGSMSTVRIARTATLLNNGKVLIAGGASYAGQLASAEIYDPVNGFFTATGNMTMPRSIHAATLLPDGKVLIVGGQSCSSPGCSRASAEIYDPDTGLFTSAGSMSTVRQSPSATLLPNGKVLIAGGDAEGPPLDSAELYDPATGTFSVTGSMDIPRSGHTALLLNDGKVLVVGRNTDSAELYNPDTETFSATGSMTTFRQSFSATLLPNGKVLVAGGYDGAVTLDSAELYDPVSGSFAPTATMSTTRVLHSATLLNNGEVLVAGGVITQNETVLDSAELYMPANQPPVAQCQDVTVAADQTCSATASIDNGSSDLDGDTITLTQSPAAPYPLGTTSVTLTVTDDKGASSTCTGTVTVTDTAPPTVEISGCPGEVYLGSSASVTVYVTDGCSEVSSQSVPNGPNIINTSAVGTKTFTVTASDIAENSASSSCTYKVIYDFMGGGGFRHPIDNIPVLNTAKAGSTVPVKWQLPNGYGGFISDLGAVTALQFQQVSCSSVSSTLSDAIEMTATGGTGLRYDFTANQYVYNWQTPRAAGNCYVALLTFNDGKQYRANFSLK